jgi:hypothetical protein
MIRNLRSTKTKSAQIIAENLKKAGFQPGLVDSKGRTIRMGTHTADGRGYDVRADQ